MGQLDAPLPAQRRAPIGGDLRPQLPELGDGVVPAQLEAQVLRAGVGCLFEVVGVDRARVPVVRVARDLREELRAGVCAQSPNASSMAWLRDLGSADVFLAAGAGAAFFFATGFSSSSSSADFTVPPSFFS